MSHQSSPNHKVNNRKLRLSQAEFAILRDLILDHTGWFYQDNKRDLLEDKLLPLVTERGFQTFLDYYYMLKYDSMAKMEWQHLVETLRVPETFFFREYDQIQALVKVLIPQHLDQEPLRIWSAACSTGEEPLSIAIALHEAGWLKNNLIEIFASDVSQQALEKAQQGWYRPYALRNFPEELKHKYFRFQQGGWQVEPKIHACVQWRMANLTSRSDVISLATARFIFCRNVFIYFSEEMIYRAVQQFYKHMPTPGYLFVGSSESLLKLMTEFELQEINGAFVYVKQ